MQSSEKKYANETLNEREKTHGDYRTVAFISQSIKNAVQISARHRAHIAQESLEMIATKMARIAAGDWREIDHWRDIAGYAELIVSNLENAHKEAMMSGRTEGGENEERNC
jgi:hypothetical protein